MRATFAAVFSLLLLALAGSEGPINGSRAPLFNGTMADGKSFKLSTELQKGPAMLYFISETCPVTKAATPFYKKLTAAYMAKGLRVLGIFNGNKQHFLNWQKENRVSFPVILDPSYQIINSYKVEHAPSTALIDKNGTIVKFWSGYSRGYLQDAGARAAKMLKISALKVDFSSAPSDPQAG